MSTVLPVVSLKNLPTVACSPKLARESSSTTAFAPLTCATRPMLAERDGAGVALLFVKDVSMAAPLRLVIAHTPPACSAMARLQIVLIGYVNIATAVTDDYRGG